MSTSVLFTNDVALAIDNVCAESAISPQQVFVFTDTNADRLVLPAVSSHFLANAHKIVMPAGEVNKNLDTLQKVWIELERCGATRSALLINVGGGVVTDLGGFATLLSRTQKRLRQASETIETAQRHSESIARRLSDVGELPDDQTRALLGEDAVETEHPFDDDDDGWD